MVENFLEGGIVVVVVVGIEVGKVIDYVVVRCWVVE